MYSFCHTHDRVDGRYLVSNIYSGRGRRVELIGPEASESHVRKVELHLRPPSA